MATTMAEQKQPGPDESGALDRELALAIVRGDALAPAHVWRRHAPMVRRIVRRAFGPDYDVEDTVQEVFLLLFAKIAQLREPAALRAFIVSLTVRCVQHQLRRRRVRRIVGLLPERELAELRSVGPDADARQALSRLYRILDRIGTRERTAFVLRHIEEMTEPEIAEALGVSPATVRRLVERAFERVSVHARNDLFLSELLPHTKGTP